MRLYTMVLIFCFNFYVNAELDPYIKRKCFNKFKLNEMEFNKRIVFDKPNDKTKCAVICIGQLKGLVYENGTLNVPEAINDVSDGLGDEIVAEKIVDSCNKVHKEEYGCVKGYRVVRCIQRQVDTYLMTGIDDIEIEN